MLFGIKPRSSQSPRRSFSTSRVAVLGVLCVLCGFDRAAAAVADYIGKPVASVRLTIEDRPTVDPELTQVVQTVVGEALSMAQVRESITHLFGLGRFEDVRVDATLENGRVALHYALSPIHPVTAIRFEGTPAADVDHNALRRAIADRYGVTPPLSRMADMARIIESVLADRGYLHATATPRADVSHTLERATLVFTVDPKIRTTIGDVQIAGTPIVQPAQLLKELGLAAGAPLQRDRLNARIERYLTDRRKRGFYEARLVPSFQFSEGDRVANVTLTVDPGPHMRVVFAGDDLPKDQRNELVPIEREGSADEDLLEDSSHRIEEHFRALGYRDAVALYTREASGSELLITFTIKRGPLYRVASYDVSGNTSVAQEELSPILRVRVDQPFADSRLDAEVAAIESFYHRRGFATARAQPAIETGTAAPGSALIPVAVTVVILEGSRTLVDSVSFSGNTAVEETTLRATIGLRAGGPYVPGQLAADRDAIQRAYQDLGYQNVSVIAPPPQFSTDRTSAAVTFLIHEGPRIVVDHVLIVGNVRTRTETIERELQVKPGDAYSLSAINESQRRLTALGLFRRARIAELRHGDETSRDLLVTIEEAPPTTIGYGAGVEGRRSVLGAASDGLARERFDVAPRALFEISRRNLFGRNRSASVFTSVSRSVRYSLTEYRAVATFREPRLFDTAADAFINGTLEQQHRSSFDFARRSLSADVQRRFSGPYRVTGTYLLQRTRVFNQQVSEIDPLIERTFQQFLLSSFAGSIIRDTRDDQVDAKDGTYVSASAQLAAGAIGSEVGFIKSSFTGQLFRRVPRTRQVVFAGNVRLGTARGFATASGLETEGRLPASERFFAGGDTTQRGFALDQLGVRHSPELPGVDTIDPDGFAIGGNGLLLFNGELRVPVTGGIGVVGFVDTGNVFAHAADISLVEMRTAIGGGIRYRSPIGPLRIDIGVKVNRQPGEKPTAWFVSFGQAF